MICNFCKEEHLEKIMIQKDDVAICSDCVDICHQMLIQQKMNKVTFELFINSVKDRNVTVEVTGIKSNA